MYAVEFFLDDVIEKNVRDIWSGLKTADITSFMADINELRPHVTVAVYNAALPIEHFKDAFITATKKMSKINVKFDIISIFPTSGTVFIPPTMTSKLIETHRNYHNELADYNAFEIGNGYNLPETWDPHCTLATRLAHDSVMKTLKFCLERFTTMKGTITEIGVVKLEFENDKCISSKTILSTLLN